MTLGALIPAVLAFAFAFMAEAGTDIFTRSFWAQCLNANHKEPPSMLLFVFAFVVAVCALPAMVVVIYYQARNKHEKPEV